MEVACYAVKGSSQVLQIDTLVCIERNSQLSTEYTETMWKLFKSGEKLQEVFILTSMMLNLIYLKFRIMGMNMIAHCFTKYLNTNYLRIHKNSSHHKKVFGKNS